MFKSLHAMRHFLETQRQVTASALGDQPMGEASCVVLGDLLTRVRSLTDRFGADAPVTLSLLGDHGEDAVAMLQLVARVLGDMANLTQEGIGVVEARRRPFIELLRTIEAEGFTIDTVTFTQVTEGRDWSVLADVDDPAVRVQLLAEQIARAEQAAVYQDQLERMNAEITAIEVDYAQRIRRLTEDR
ncbi:hypothetical protein [Mycolicibacterium thermoresistibile]